MRDRYCTANRVHCAARHKGPPRKLLADPPAVITRLLLVVSSYAPSEREKAFTTVEELIRTSDVNINLSLFLSLLFLVCWNIFPIELFQETIITPTRGIFSAGSAISSRRNSMMANIPQTDDDNREDPMTDGFKAAWSEQPRQLYELDLNQALLSIKIPPLVHGRW